jgi:penicillin-binding protein 1A
VLPNGKEDTSAGWGKPKRKRVISDGVAYTVTRILQENVWYGTGQSAAFRHPSAGKTGTTDDHADAWYCGYTPRLMTTVWVGHPEGEIPMENVHGIRVAGGTFPAEIWRLYMDAAIGHLEPVSFSEPTQWPVWQDFEQGQENRSFGYTYDPGYSSGGGEETPTEEEDEEEAPPAPAPTPSPPPSPPPTVTQD